VLTVCAQPGCGQDAVRDGRCSAHQLKRERERDRSRERCRSHAWRKLRAQVLARDRYVCAICGASANSVDHVVRVADRGSDDPLNLRAACSHFNLRRG